jgi:hypothetical protein
MLPKQEDDGALVAIQLANFGQAIPEGALFAAIPWRREVAPFV